MTRAILDTNVYVAALLSRDASPARLIRALSEGLFDAIVCPRLLGELRGVLARPKIAVSIAPDDAQSYMEWLSRVAILAPDPRHIESVSPDPDDDYLLALARESGTQVIVSGDGHLLGLKCSGLRVLSPAMFADFVESLR